MAIDYSKWDKLEISDDSDVEVHPNVDKNSFIRWKQRDIHEKRQMRNQEIKTILVQLTMYKKLNERVDYLLKELLLSEIGSNDVVMKKIESAFDKNERFDYDALIKEKGDNLRKGLKDLTFEPSEIQDTPPYNEMVEDLFEQIKEDHEDASDASKLVDYLKDHRAKIDDILSKQAIKLDDLLYQKSLLISSDDYHTGFDKSFLNKDKEEAPPAKTSKETVTTIETLNEPSSTSNQPTSSPPPAKTEAEELAELEILPETEEFSKIPMNNYDESTKYLLRHPHICTEQQKDALIMTAFDHQLAGDSASAKQIIHQSLLLQYISHLCGNKPTKDAQYKAVSMFMGKINDPSFPVRTGFLQDVDNTFNHIKTRCEILKQEQAEGDEDGEALIQLRALDEDTQLSITLPEPETEEYDIFTNELPKEMQEALKTESLDEVNKVFASYKIEEGERVLDIINRCGVIGVSGYIEDETEFEELQKQYNEQSLEDKELEPNVDTADIVD